MPDQVEVFSRRCLPFRVPLIPAFLTAEIHSKCNESGKQAGIQAGFHPHLSLERQYCCKRERRVRSINMRRNNLIYWPTATNYHRPGTQHKSLFQEGVGHTQKNGLIDIPN